MNLPPFKGNVWSPLPYVPASGARKMVIRLFWEQDKPSSILGHPTFELAQMYTLSNYIDISAQH